MKFIVFQCSESPRYFVVTDKEHVADVKRSPFRDGSGLKEIGGHGGIGEKRVTFDESVAMSSIAEKGYYCFEAPNTAR